jgi:hypothetical protein
VLWGAQAASLFISAACRNALLKLRLAREQIVAGKLPATAGWQPALPQTDSQIPVITPKQTIALNSRHEKG